MNAAQKKAMVYGNLINNTVQSIQDEQDKLNPEFETLRKALDRDQIERIDSVEYTKIMHDFKKGTDSYQDLLTKLQKAKAPARYMGTHMSLVAAFKKYVEGCTEMTESIGEDQKIDREKFNNAEKVQDENMDKFSKYMQKMTEI
ncbi:hypothetical protein M5C72_02940 [Companilactobacillus allii]|uniref:Chemotaxis protein n=1 Tax=Companilactobacillus allii TaxID=1847728 RepID=A0A1P8Q2Q2_9LACO|nr:hypothetical protein [Companilactobacillus allii]APX72115.1 hypothetical protein BTM29_05865 [Companilactobacillus allii]USQ69210.1 hypothetical protein M5C72_02940 [Companilactobacillus allii]